MLARYMDESRSIPTATSFRTITVTAMDARRKQLKDAGQKVSFTHLIAYAIAQAAQHDMPVMAHHFDEVDGKPHRVDDGQVNLGIAVDVEKKDGTRTLMVPVIRDAGRMSFADFKAAFDELIEKARTNTLTADDLTGANISLTNPGGIGTIASVPRLMVGQGTIVATGSIAYPVGLAEHRRHDRRREGHDDDLDLRPPRSSRARSRGASCRSSRPTCRASTASTRASSPRWAPSSARAPAPPAPAAAAAAARDGAPAARQPRRRVDEQMLQAVQAATSLLKAHRTHGHLAARLDPLGTEPEGDPALEPDDRSASRPRSWPRSRPRSCACTCRGRRWPTRCRTCARPTAARSPTRSSTSPATASACGCARRSSAGAFRKPLTTDEQKALLQRLVEVDALERFMHKAYLGQKQFSIEGLDMTVPMLDEAIQLAAAHGAREVVVGMAHRGRLNVLAHNLGRPYETIFAEFEGASTLEAVTSIPQGGTGDVKYHHGAQGTYQLPNGDSILVNLESNPSHLEFVHPVVVGATRAAQTTRQGPHAHRDTDAAVPIVLHGDAAFPGQGVVAESLNLQALDGYKVGGTIHLIQNNQVGFTTDPEDARSTRWASDIAKGYDTPIIHVNADDVAGLRHRRAPGLRLPRGVRPRRRHRPHRLPALRPQRGRRARVHAARDVRARSRPRSASASCGPSASSRTASSPRRRSRASARTIWDELTRLHQDLKQQIKAAEDAGAVEQATGEYQLDRSPSPEVADRGLAPSACASLNERAAARCPTASPCTPSSSSSSSAAARRWAPTAASTGRTPRRWPSPRC